MNSVNNIRSMVYITIEIGVTQTGTVMACLLTSVFSQLNAGNQPQCIISEYNKI